MHVPRKLSASDELDPFHDHGPTPRLRAVDVEVEKDLNTTPEAEPVALERQAEPQARSEMPAEFIDFCRRHGIHTRAA